MNSIFKICKVSACEISITGLEYEDHQYSEEFSQEAYRFEDCVTVNALIPVSKNGDEGNFVYSIDIHDKVDPSPQDETIIEFPKDGLFRIVHLLVPTRQWVEQANILPKYMYEEGKFYKYVETSWEEVDLKEIIYVNHENIIKSDKHTFCLCRLQNCYYNFAKDFFKKLCSDKCSLEQNKNRDILYIGVNSIKYLLELGRYYEAQGILEQLTGCTGLCQEAINNKNYSTYGCGCSN